MIIYAECPDFRGESIPYILLNEFIKHTGRGVLGLNFVLTTFFSSLGTFELMKKERSSDHTDASE